MCSATQVTPILAGARDTTCTSTCVRPRRPILPTDVVLAFVPGASFPVLQRWRCEIPPGLLLWRCTLFAPTTRPTKKWAPSWLACCRPNPVTLQQELPQKMAMHRNRPLLVLSRLALRLHATCTRNCTKQRWFRPRRFRQGECRRATCLEHPSYDANASIGLYFSPTVSIVKTSNNLFICRDTRGRAPARWLVIPILAGGIPWGLRCP